MFDVVFSSSARGGMRCARFSRLEDIYSLSLGLSVGSISEDVPGAQRRAALLELCRASEPEAEAPGRVDRLMEDAAGSLEAILARSAEGEAVRIWYSDEPDEACTFLWLLSRLDGLGDRRGPVGAVKLPRYEQREDGVVEEHTGWGDVRPESWQAFLPLERPASPASIRAAAHRWRELQEEDAPLRAVVNGRLSSVPEEFYDSFIRRELARMPEEFREAVLIGQVLGRHRLGIGDGLVACRVEAMIRAGELEAVTQAAAEEAPYRRILRKKRPPSR